MPVLGGEIASELRKADRELGLPPRIRLVQVADDFTGWASHYGGLQELAGYARLFKWLPVRFKATWQHGVFSEYRYCRHPKLLLYGASHASDRLILVATEHQADCLNAIGFTNVHPVGLPFLYAQPTHLPERRLGSVLAMPAHSLDGSPFENEEMINAYATWLFRKYNDSVDTLFACIHMSCIRNNQWWPAMLGNGLRVVGGADHGDGNSYQRMWKLFARFDTVTTNRVGSHFYYALAAGCKVVIEGPDVEFSKDQIMKDITYQRMVQSGMSLDLSAEGEREVERLKSDFGVPRQSPEIGNLSLGAGCKRSPSEIRNLLQWSKRKQIYDSSLDLTKSAGVQGLKLARKAYSLPQRCANHFAGQ